MNPALNFLHRRGAAVRFGHRLRRIAYVGGAASRLRFGAETVVLRGGDSVVLALPPLVTAGLVPGLSVPEQSHAIVNVHFRLPEPAGLAADLPLLGLIGGTAQWLFARGDVVSITVSAADSLATEPADVIARKAWADVAAALGFGRGRGAGVSCHQGKARYLRADAPRARDADTVPRTKFANLYLAGDWIDTGLPATIESAVRSAHMVAHAVAGDGRIGAGE